MKDQNLKRETLTFEDIATFPSPGNIFPDEFSFSSDDKYMAYLYSPNNDLFRSLWIFNMETKERRIVYGPAKSSDETLSQAEQLRRERQRQMALGVTIFQWAEKTNKLLFNDSTGIYVIDFNESEDIRKIIDLTQKPCIDPQFSPNGEWISYVYQDEIFITSFNGKETRQLTFNARKNGLTHGVAEYIAQEEMRRSHGYWWSPNNQFIAFTEVDEKHIQMMKIVHQGDEKFGEHSMEEFKYPFAGEMNAIVKLAVVDITNLDIVWMNLGENKDIYLARVNWLADKNLSAQIVNRDQTDLDLISFDISSGTANRILREHNDIWINNHDMLNTFHSEKFTNQFVWASERNGFMHLYLYNLEGNLIKQLTKGSYVIDRIVAIDEDNEIIFVETSGPNPTEKHLVGFSISDNTSFFYTKEPGTHNTIMNNECTIFVDLFSSLSSPPSVVLRSVKEQSIHYSLFNVKDPKIEAMLLEPPKLVSINIPDGTPLYGAIFQPNSKFGKGPYPTIVTVYGGPHAQLVTNNWILTSALRIQNLRNNGFLVFVLDNRGSARRGIEFEKVLKGKFGKYEVEDQVFGVKWLIDQGLADKNRIGVYGWSYGGYMSLMCLSKAPDVFKAGFAGAPTNDMRDYDTHYTERYLGKPQDNPNGYDETKVSTHIDKMQGKLLIAHGLIDENVHFRHTAKLINTMVKLNKKYSLLVFPDGRHSFRKIEDRVYLEQKLFEFFSNSL